MKVSVIGSGYVGLVSAACFSHLGHDVACVDQNPDRVSAINSSKPPFFEPGLEGLIAAGVKSGRLTATQDGHAAVLNSDVTFIAVGTPDHDGVIDLSQIRSAAATIGLAIKEKQNRHVVVTKSTVIPGTNKDVIEPEIRSIVSEGDFAVCMNPEFLRQGLAVQDFMAPDRIVVGADEESAADIVLDLYEGLAAPRMITSIHNAELIKYASNALLATMVSFSNEIANICECTPDADVGVVLEGVRLDRRITTKNGEDLITPGIASYMAAGGGFGGSCLPKDVQAFKSYAESRNVEAPLLNSVIQVNKNRPDRVVQLAEEALGSLDGASVALLGLTFKPGTDDLRHSPAVAIMDLLHERGARIEFWDPMAPEGCEMAWSGVVRKDTPESILENAECAIVATAWPALRDIDWENAAATMKNPIVVDSRLVFQGSKPPQSLKYIPIGNFKA